MRSMSWLIASLILIIFCFISSPGISQDACKLKQDKEGIKVYSCLVPKSDFRSVTAKFQVATTINKYLNTIRDIENYGDWQYNIVESRLLERISDSELIYYLEIAAPWPVSHRDLVLHLSIKNYSGTGKYTITLNSLQDYLPPKKDIVRVPWSQSTMIVTPKGNSQLNFEYYVHLSPGGSLPAWLVNTVSTQGPYETFRKLKGILSDEK